MSIQKPTEINVFTGGFFESVVEKVKYAISVFTGGMFSGTAGDNTFQLDPIKYSNVLKDNQFIIEKSLDWQAFPTTQSPYLRIRSAANDGTRQLFQSLGTEAYLQRGLPVEYYRITVDNPGYPQPNKILGEQQLRYVIGYYKPLMVRSQTIFKKQSRIWSKLGIEDDQSHTVWVPKDHFEHLCTGIPQGGDIIYVRSIDLYLMVLSRDEGEQTDGQSATYLQSKQYMWALETRVYRPEPLQFLDQFKNTDLYKLTSRQDIFDNTNIIDVKKEPILYSSPLESNSRNPFISF